MAGKSLMMLVGYLSRVEAFLESGTYYIEVKAYEDVALSGAFTIQSGVIEPTWLEPDTNEILSQWLEVLGERLPEFDFDETLIFSGIVTMAKFTTSRAQLLLG